MAKKKSGGSPPRNEPPKNTQTTVRDPRLSQGPRWNPPAKKSAAQALDDNMANAIAQQNAPYLTNAPNKPPEQYPSYQGYPVRGNPNLFAPAALSASRMNPTRTKDDALTQAYPPKPVTGWPVKSATFGEEPGPAWAPKYGESLLSEAFLAKYPEYRGLTDDLYLSEADDLRQQKPGKKITRESKKYGSLVKDLGELPTLPNTGGTGGGEWAERDGGGYGGWGGGGGGGGGGYDKNMPPWYYGLINWRI